MDSPVKQRLKEYLRQKRIGQNKFAVSCGLSTGFVSSIVNSIQPHTLDRIIQQYPDLNRVWLLTGEGEMLRNVEAGENGTDRLTVDVMPATADTVFGKGVIPFFDREIACGPACDYNASIEASKADGTISLPNVEGDFALIARGDSMVDPEHPDKSIPSGSLVVLKKATDDILRWGEVYALATADGFLIKKVMPTDDSERIELRSLNASEFPPFCVRKKDVYGVARVVAVVNYRLY